VTENRALRNLNYIRYKFFQSYSPDFITLMNLYFIRNRKDIICLRGLGTLIYIKKNPNLQ